MLGLATTTTTGLYVQTWAFQLLGTRDEWGEIGPVWKRNLDDDMVDVVGIILGLMYRVVVLVTVP